MELAQICGRTVFNETDWQQAKRELHGGQAAEMSDEADTLSEVVSPDSMLHVNSGHHIANIPVEDAGNIVEELIAEGMDEAVHEQMLEASRLNEKEEEG